MWKNKKFSLTEKIFREINYSLTPLVKTLVSRNFSQKCVRENSRNFHTVGNKSGLYVEKIRFFSFDKILREFDLVYVFSKYFFNFRFDVVTT